VKSGSISVILLAAGGSSRFGRPKQLLKIGTTSLIRKLADEALACRANEVIVVVGAEADKIRKELEGLDLRIVENKNWETGLSSSIKVGVKAAGHCDGALLMLCDQPYTGRYLLNEIIDRFQSTEAPAVASEYGQTVGVPALISKSLFPELLKLRGDSGAKSILLNQKEKLERVSFPKGAVDIDTSGDLEALPR